MALPKQVQKQLDEVEELEKALEAQLNPEKTEAEDADVEKEEPDTEAQETAEAEQEPEPKEAKPADTVLTDVEDDFKQKYSTLRGKYDAEVPRLHAQLRDVTEELAAFRKEMTEKKMSV